LDAAACADADIIVVDNARRGRHGQRSPQARRSRGQRTPPGYGQACLAGIATLSADTQIVDFWTPTEAMTRRPSAPADSRPRRKSLTWRLASRIAAGKKNPRLHATTSIRQLAGHGIDARILRRRLHRPRAHSASSAAKR